MPQRLRLRRFQLIHKGQSVADTPESRVEIVVQQRHGSHCIRVRQRLGFNEVHRCLDAGNDFVDTQIGDVIQARQFGDEVAEITKQVVGVECQVGLCSDSVVQCHGHGQVGIEGTTW